VSSSSSQMSISLTKWGRVPVSAHCRIPMFYLCK
jgi:hypothetical protein